MYVTIWNACAQVTKQTSTTLIPLPLLFLRFITNDKNWNACKNKMSKKMFYMVVVTLHTVTKLCVRVRYFYAHYGVQASITYRFIRSAVCYKILTCIWHSQSKVALRVYISNFTITPTCMLNCLHWTDNSQKKRWSEETPCGCVVVIY